MSSDFYDAAPFIYGLLIHIGILIGGLGILGLVGILVFTLRGHYGKDRRRDSESQV